MSKLNARAVKRIFVKVFGFSDVERHALNTVFRLSEARPLAYAPWTTAARHAAEVLLIDGNSWEAALELANPTHDALTLIWVGDNAPTRARLVFPRPLQWAAVIERVDELLAFPSLRVAPHEGPGDDGVLDRRSEGGVQPDTKQTKPNFNSHVSTVPLPLASGHAHVLVVDASAEARFYLRAKLATAGLPKVDEAASGAEALQRIRRRVYKLVLLDLDLPDRAAWALVKQLARSRPEVLILTGSKVSRLDRLRGWFAGARSSLRKPLDPGKLQTLLRNVV